MLRRTTMAQAVSLALATILGGMSTSVLAQGDAGMQRVEITGSSIKRINAEGALPVQLLSKEAIARTGATTVAELLQALPAMQDFTIAATAAGSNSGGRVSASIHGIGEEYTLVLLDGRRLAPQGSGSVVNLNAIPMSAIERIEILTDGASALYGADAIGGVINFILKKSAQGVKAEASYGQPQAGRAGGTSSASITGGIGNLEDDRYSIVASYRHDEQSKIKSTQRDFAKTAYIPFNFNGQRYIYDRTSATTIPANVSVKFNNSLPAVGFSPYLKKNGSCPELNVISLSNTSTTQNCAFDFVQTVEMLPENKRDSLYTKATFKLSSDVNLFSEVALSRYDLTARIAPNTAPFTIATTSPYYKDYVLPYLTAQQAANVKSVSGNYRTYDWGGRASETITDSRHVVVGAEGDIGGWAFGAGLTWSQNKIDERYVNGYALDKEFRDMLNNRSFDPFAPIGTQSDATKALIEKSIFHGSVRTADTTLKGVDGHASRELFDLPGGKSSLGLGGDYREYHYGQAPSKAAATGMIYNLDAPPAYDMTRHNIGAFAEFVAPVTKTTEVTLAARRDTISAIDAFGAKLGKRESANTYKLAGRWQPSQTLLVRGSYGTGFKAPTMLDIGQPLVNYGFTSGAFDCPIASAQYCRPGKSQYNELSGGNPDLKPERSKQYTIGFRLEPTRDFSFGADLWDVRMRDKVSAVSEAQVFADPVKFRDLFTTYTEPATGNTYWAMKSLQVNIGSTHNQGIDWDLTSRQHLSVGTFTANLNGTYLRRADYTEPGSDSVWTSSLNTYGTDEKVAFRHIVRFTGTLETGNLTNSLIVNYRNGYQDALTTVRNVGTGKNEQIRLHVPSHLTVDWQGRYVFTKALAVRAGIKNLFDREPPLSLRSSSGHQVGFDPRYADPLGRSVYMSAEYLL